MNLRPVKATLLDDDAFRLLAIPFSGPIPYPGAPKGADTQMQWFGKAVDIKRDWLPFRPVDWHHGADPYGKMGRTTFGKAIDLGRQDGASREPDDDGWWVTVWLQHGEDRLRTIRRLADAAAARTSGVAIFGSSETLPGLSAIRTAKGQLVPWEADIPGEIVSWPYWRQTLSTSPVNTHSVLRPLKATLDDIERAGERPDPTFWSELEEALHSLGHSLRATSGMGAHGAKAGRVLSAANETDLREALEALAAAQQRAMAVLERQPNYDTSGEQETST